MRQWIWCGPNDASCEIAPPSSLRTPSPSPPILHAFCSCRELKVKYGVSWCPKVDGKTSTGASGHPNLSSHAGSPQCCTRSLSAPILLVCWKSTCVLEYGSSAYILPSFRYHRLSHAKFLTTVPDVTSNISPPRPRVASTPLTRPRILHCPWLEDLQRLIGTLMYWGRS